MFKKIMMISLLIPVYDFASAESEKLRDAISKARSERNWAICAGVSGCLLGSALSACLICAERGESRPLDAREAAQAKMILTVGICAYFFGSLESFAYAHDSHKKMHCLNYEMNRLEEMNRIRVKCE